MSHRMIAHETEITTFNVDVIVNEIGLKDMAEMFLAGHDARDPLAAPLYGDFAGIPPLFRRQTPNPFYHLSDGT